MENGQRIIGSSVPLHGKLTVTLYGIHTYDNCPECIREKKFPT
jgi:hypothetical protein